MDTIIYFKNVFSNFPDLIGNNLLNSQCIVANNSILGDYLIKEYDSSRFIVDSNYTINWKSNATNWSFCIDDTCHLIIQLDSTIAFSNDSIRYYSFSTNAPISHTFHNYDSVIFSVSLNKGMLDGFDFSYFPKKYNRVKLFEKGPIISDKIYDYEIGDEFHYSDYRNNNFMNVNTVFYIKKILNKIFIGNDSVKYYVERKSRNAGSSNGYLVYKWEKYSLKDTIGSGTYLEGDGIKYSKGFGIYDGDYGRHSYVDVGTKIFLAMPPPYYNSNYVFRTLEDTLCYDGFENFEKREYIFGIGDFYQSNTYGQSGINILEETLLYYKKGNTTWGTPITIAIPTGVEENALSQIKFYPNPVENLFTIENLVEDCRYKLMDINEKIVKEGYFVNSTNSINTIDFDSGIYFLQLQSKKDLRTIKMVKK